MAQLKDLIVNGAARIISDLFVNGTLKFNKVNIDGTEYQVRVTTTDAGAAGYITFVI